MQSKLVNKVASYVFAIFAMNYFLINVAVELIEEYAPQLTELGDIGFVMIPIISIVIMIICVLVGILRDLLLSKADDVIATKVERIYEHIVSKAIHN